MIKIHEEIKKKINEKINVIQPIDGKSKGGYNAYNFFVLGGTLTAILHIWRLFKFK